MRREQIDGPVFPHEYDQLRKFVAFRFWWVKQFADDIAVEFIEFFARRRGDLNAGKKFREFLRAHPLDLKNIARKYTAKAVEVPLDVPGRQLADHRAAEVTEMLDREMSLTSAIDRLPKDRRAAVLEWVKAGYSRKLAVEALVDRGIRKTRPAAQQLLTRARQQLIDNLKTGR